VWSFVTLTIVEVTLRYVAYLRLGKRYLLLWTNTNAVAIKDLLGERYIWDNSSF
jgi:Na+/pantothenate symporter